MRDQPFLPPEPRTDGTAAGGSTPHSPPTTGHRRLTRLDHAPGSRRTTAAPAPLEAPHAH